MYTMFIVLTIFVLSIILDAVFLRIGANWAKIPKIGFLRALVTTFMIVVFSLAIHLGYSWLTTEIVDPPPLLALLFEFALVMFVTFSTIAIFFRTTYKRAICSWLVTLIPAVAKVVLIFFVLNPFLLEAFVVANQSMSPVLRGTHQIGKCPSCGQQAIAGFHPEFERLDAYRRFGICLTCNKTDEIGDLIPVLQQPDRIIVNKIQTAKRWDIVAYKSLTYRPQIYVHRLVGLPGEEIIIKEGEIWIKYPTVNKLPNITIQYSGEFHNSIHHETCSA